MGDGLRGPYIADVVNPCPLTGFTASPLAQPATVATIPPVLTIIPIK